MSNLFILFMMGIPLYVNAQMLYIDTVCLRGGRFQMGDVMGGEQTGYFVELTPFCISRYEITNAQYVVFLNDIKISEQEASRYIKLEGESVDEPSAIYYDWKEKKYKVRKGFEQYPVVYVSWYGAMEFARWAGGSLPTEAQWEYACRSGKNTLYATGQCISDKEANYDARKVESGCPKGDFRGKSMPVGSFQTNHAGIYDLHGNVFEWCQDWFAEYPRGSFQNHGGPASGQNKIRRGGSFLVNAKNCSCIHRSIAPPTAQFKDLGFRVVFPK